MKPKQYKVGCKCSAGHTVHSILGQSDAAVVYTTKDGQLRWDHNDNGKLPAKFGPVISRFDSLMADIASSILSKPKRLSTYHLLGKGLFLVLDSGNVKSADECFKPVEQLLAPTGAQPAATATKSTALLSSKASREVFLVHGHDNGVKEMVARFLERLKLKVIILHEQAEQSRTVIEKFEDHSDVTFAIILLTPDDFGGVAKKTKERKPRARQNVVFEFGFFIGKLGRDRVHALIKGDVELPSDCHGIIYTPLDEGSGWKIAVVKELKRAGLKVRLDHAA